MKKALVVLCLFALVLSIPLSSYAGGISLVIPDEGWGVWKKVSTKRISFTFDVMNTNPEKTINSFDVTYYPCDQFKQLNGPAETVTLYQDIQSYETIKSPEIFLVNSNADNIYYVYIAITLVRFADDTYEYDPDPAYCYWTLNDY